QVTPGLGARPRLGDGGRRDEPVPETLPGDGVDDVHQHRRRFAIPRGESVDDLCGRGLQLLEAFPLAAHRNSPPSAASVTSMNFSTTAWRRATTAISAQSSIT